MEHYTPAPLLRLRAAAAYLAVHPGTLRRWVCQGRVSCERLGARGDLRFRQTDLDEFLRSRRPRPNGEGR